MDRHLEFVKDSVIGELSSRIGKPIPEFNKNKRGKENIIIIESTHYAGTFETILRSERG